MVIALGLIPQVSEARISMGPPGPLSPQKAIVNNNCISPYSSTQAKRAFQFIDRRWIYRPIGGRQSRLKIGAAFNALTTAGRQSPQLSLSSAMEFFLGILLGVGVIALAIFSRSITTFIHELGHAIPALLFTNDKVVMVVGSYGDLENSVGFRLGRLNIFLKFNIVVWYEGLCMYAPVNSFTKSLLITLGGPLMSLLFAVGLFVWIVQGGQTAGVITIVGIFILSAFWDFCVNMYPRSRATPLNDGTVIFNDGYSILQLIRSQGQSSSFQSAMSQLREKDVAGAVKTLEGYLDKKPSRHGAEQLVNLLFDQQHVAEGIEAFERYIKPLPRKQRDYLLLARLYKAENNNASALECINKYLHLEFKDSYARNLRGEIFLELNESEKAMADFHSVIQINPGNHLAANNFGFLLTKKGEVKAAAEFIERGLPYLENSARAQFQAGFYYKDSNQYEKALICFLKAKAMGFEHYGLEHYIVEVEPKDWQGA